MSSLAVAPKRGKDTTLTLSRLALSITPPPGSVANANGASLATRTGAVRGFLSLDGRLREMQPGIVVVRTAAESARALSAHAARRARAAGARVVTAGAREAASVFVELAARLSGGNDAVGIDAAELATRIAAVAARGALVLVLPVPRSGSFDAVVLDELARSSASLLLVLIDGDDRRTSAAQFATSGWESFEVEARLSDEERACFLAAATEDAVERFASRDLAELTAWWEAAARAPIARTTPDLARLGTHARALLAALAEAGRSWPAGRISDLGSIDSLLELAGAGAIEDEHAWVTLVPSWHDVAREAAEAVDAATKATIANALSTTFADDPWALARAASLLAEAGRAEQADAALARALVRANDPAARREVVQTWSAVVARVDRGTQKTLLLAAAERALDAGESEEAHRWAENAVQIDPDDARVLFTLGRACVTRGDLVAARLALSRAKAKIDAQQETGVCGAQVLAELAEVEYLSGDLEAAKRVSELCVASSPDEAVRLRVRNTLGKLLLSEAKWNEADAHFAEDVWASAAHGDRSSELRARLNRGIALLSKGQRDEAESLFAEVLAEGEAAGEARAQAFALDNLAVMAMWRHASMEALRLMERALVLRQRLGDRLRLATILANLAELRANLGLYDHAEHAVAFGRKLLGPGMPPARASHFAVIGARIALARGDTLTASREITRAIADGETAGDREFLGEACRVATRIALEDGIVGRAREFLGRARALATRPNAFAEVALLDALCARAAGDNAIDLAELAVERGLEARQAGVEEHLLEACALFASLLVAASSTAAPDGRREEARAMLGRALEVRDRVAGSLEGDVRTAYLSRKESADLARLSLVLAEDPLPTIAPGSADDAPHTLRAAGTVGGTDTASMASIAGVRTTSTSERRIVGEDPTIVALRRAITKVAKADTTVLIHGESGTGKELVAAALHVASDRKNGPLVSVNCAALVESLLLSELFGHEKGAFTGAAGRKRGRFELAEGGTLFLDEIGDISPRTQVALLRVLQEKTFERVGGTTPIRANVRIVCATHRDLLAMVERGEFREDLYYRLRGITLEVPALRHRLSDLPRISTNLLERIASERNQAPKTLSSDALDLLARHRWPGNIRELDNVLRAAVLFADGETMTAEDLIENVDILREVASHPPVVTPAPPSVVAVSRLAPAPVSVPTSSSLGAEDEGAADDAPLPDGEAQATAIAYAQVRTGATSLADIKRQIERDCIARALEETKGNITRAAALLGMKRPRLSQLVKQYGLLTLSSEGL